MEFGGRQDEVAPEAALSTLTSWGGFRELDGKVHKGRRVV